VKPPTLALPFKPRVVIVPAVLVLLVVVAFFALTARGGEAKAEPVEGPPPARRVLCGGDGLWACRRWRAPGPDHLWDEIEGPAWLLVLTPMADGRWVG
jgi:hypothetical protein